MEKQCKCKNVSLVRCRVNLNYMAFYLDTSSGKLLSVKCTLCITTISVIHCLFIITLCFYDVY